MYKKSYILLAEEKKNRFIWLAAYVAFIAAFSDDDIVKPYQQRERAAWDEVENYNTIVGETIFIRCWWK